MSKRLPGGHTAHVDTFAADNLPPLEALPKFDFDGLPILRSYPDRINAGAELLDRMCVTGFGDNPVL
ncbi:MAG: 2-aminobenzoate-CoA ligase, partial [Pseudomonadota bacterium]|nr:2-aminobenzoate-CoA ligase [Pseudomonadota bacterium]